MTTKTLLVIKKDDYTVERLYVYDKYNQYKKRRAEGARIRHPRSGATAVSQVAGAMFFANKIMAMEALIKNPKFQKWAKKQCSYIISSTVHNKKDVDDLLRCVHCGIEGNSIVLSLELKEKYIEKASNVVWPAA